jgi:hypothetical protein
VKKREQYSESKVPRTHGWHWNPDYDKMLAQESMSGLRFLQGKYKHEKRIFRENFDIEQQIYMTEYLTLCKIEGMINEEIQHRISFDSANIKEEWFDSDNGIVYDECGVEKYAVAYNDEEDEIMYVNLNAKASSECREEDDETDYEFYEPVDKKEKYIKWDYTKFLDKEADD